MKDRSWMLNAEAIKAARACVDCVKKELDIKLTLSHPDFMTLLHEYVEMTDSKELGTAYARLLSHAGVGKTVRDLPPEKGRDQKHKKAVGSDNSSAEELVEYGGKSYPKYRDGKKFTGVYRGQPRYA